MKWITTIIEKELTNIDSFTNHTNFSLFTAYQKQSHLEYINEDSDVTKIIEPDQYILRNIKTELFQSLQTFDLMKYGGILTRFIIDKCKNELQESYHYVLGQLFYSLPDPVAVKILWESTTTLQRMKPNRLKEICLQIVNGSIFKTSADLSIAFFFSELAKEDLIQADIWREYSEEFEKMAFNEIADIETDHMMLVLLTIPLFNYDGTSKCLIELAQERERVVFLNSERITDVINYIYTNGYLKPQDEMYGSASNLSTMLREVFWHPFQFYLTGQGYHWCSGILYAEYLILLFVYAFFWPLAHKFDNAEYTLFCTILEIIFWCNNLGYILFEIYEYIEKGAKRYFNFHVMGETNVIDVLVCSIWIILFTLRVAMHVKNPGFALSKSPLEQIFVFVFGVQILLATFRAFKIVNSTMYFGTIIRVIKLMVKEFIKFAIIFFMMMTAALFGLWFISGISNYDDDEGFWDNGFRFGFLYILEIFTGTKEISEFEMDGIAALYLTIQSIFGTLLLLNLLIALMAAKYEEVQKQAHADVVLNKTELAFDLLGRSRHMPPPLNIILYVVAFIVWFFNFFISVCKPQWNVFGYIHYNAFENLKMYNVWKCMCKKNPPNANAPDDKSDKKPKKLLKLFELMSGRDVLSWYGGCILDFVLTFIPFSSKCSTFNKIKDWNRQKTQIRIHHKGCYGLLKRTNKDKKLTVNGITMSKYFDKYETAKKTYISRQDRITLNRLTANTLFCPHCYQSFIYDKHNIDKVEDELVSPFVPLFDYISAILFVCVPIAWIPILIIIGLGAFKDYLLNIFKTKDVNKYSNQDYDRNYFPQFIPSSAIYS